MFCVIGLKHDGKVFIGADSASSITWSGSQRMLPEGRGKVFKNGNAIFGVVGDCRVAQVVRYNFSMPDRGEKETIHNYMNKTFIEALMDCLVNANCAKKSDNVSTMSGYMLIGYDGELFMLYADFYLGYITENYISFGSGEDLALGGERFYVLLICLYHRLTTLLRIAKIRY